MPFLLVPAVLAAATVLAARYQPMAYGSTENDAELVPGLTGSYPIALAGPVRYSWPGMDGSGQLPPPTSRVLHHPRLAPGQEFFRGFLVRTSACAQKDGRTSVPSFSVTERFLFFRQTVDIPWGLHGNNLIMHMPGGRPGSPGTFCVGHR